MADTTLAESTSVLERRYRRLLVAYPADYRAQRGDEIVGTLLDLAGPGRRAPSLPEAADIISGGLRRRIGLSAVDGLERGAAIAAPFALAIAAGISAFAWWRVEPVDSTGYIGGTALFGHFRTLGPIAYAAWLITAIAWPLLRRPAGRMVIAGSALVTVTLPFVAPLTTVDRPPLWVLMALTVFGLLALAGTSAAAATPRTTDERFGVPAGAIAVAVSASVVVLAWPPSGAGFGYYYQPTIARVGTVVAATVATVVLVAIVRLRRGRSAYEWLWATVLLGLPAGWLGPFDSTALRIAADETVPHFGRLAQVLLATCFAAVAMAWLVHRRRPAGVMKGLGTAGSATLGAVAGLVAFVLLAGLGVLGFQGQPISSGLPAHVIAALGVLLTVGVVAVVAEGIHQRPMILGALTALVAAWIVGAYDNGWSPTGWLDYQHTLVLVTTTVFVPLSACAYTAALRIASGTRGRIPAWTVLALCLGWLGYTTVPYIFSWGPVLLVLIACCAVLAFTPRG